MVSSAHRFTEGRCSVQVVEFSVTRKSAQQERLGGFAKVGVVADLVLNRFWERGEFLHRESEIKSRLKLPDNPALHNELLGHQSELLNFTGFCFRVYEEHKF